MSFAENFERIETYVQEGYIPFVKNRLEEAALRFLNSHLFKLTVCTDLITQGYAIIAMTLKIEGLVIGFNSVSTTRISPPDSDYEHIAPAFSPPFDFATVARRTLVDTSIRREIVDKAVKDFFAGFEVSFIEGPGEIIQTFRYKISKRV